jgi:outer membrane protein TolC
MNIRLTKNLSIAILAILITWTAKAQDKPAPLELTLDKAIKIALSENPTVKVADMDIQKKIYAKKSAKSALYPEIDAAAQYMRTLKKQVMYMDMGSAFDINSMLMPVFQGMEQTFKGSVPNYVDGTLMQNIAANTPPPSNAEEGFTVGMDNNYTGGLNLTWPVVVPTLWKTLQLSSLDVELAVENARSSKINMVNAVRKAYYGVLMAKDVVRVYQESYDNAVLNFKNIQSKFQQGIASEYDMIRADVNAKNFKPNLIQAQNAYNLATLSLKALMGIDMDREISVSGTLYDYEQSLYGDILRIDTTLTNNSDLKKFDIQTSQLQKTLELYKAQYLPTVSITGNYVYMSMNNNFRFGDYKWNPYSTIALNVSIPIFDGFRKANDIKQTKASLIQMQWQREDMVRNLKLAINSNVSNMGNYVEQVLSTKDVIAEAQKGYEISQKLYDTGMGTLLDMNNSQLGLTQARLAFAQAIYNFLASKADLDKTLGIEVKGER